MKKLIYLFLLLFISAFVSAQDASPTAPKIFNPSPTFYKSIANGDTTISAKSNSDWWNFARENWVKKYFISKSDSTSLFVTPYNLKNTKLTLLRNVDSLITAGVINGFTSNGPVFINDTLFFDSSKQSYIRDHGASQTGQIELKAQESNFFDTYGEIALFGDGNPDDGPVLYRQPSFPNLLYFNNPYPGSYNILTINNSGGQIGSLQNITIDTLAKYVSKSGSFQGYQPITGLQPTGIPWIDSATQKLTADTSFFVVHKKSGRVGIGAPIIDIWGTSLAANPMDDQKATLTIVNTTGYQDGESVLDVRSYVNGSDNTAEIRADRAEGTINAKLPITQAYNMGEFDIGGWDGTRWEQNARMHGVAMEDWGTGHHGEALSFRATKNVSTSTVLSFLATGYGVSIHGTSEIEVPIFPLTMHGTIGSASNDVDSLGSSTHYWAQSFIDTMNGGYLHIGTNIPSDLNNGAEILPTYTASTGYDGLISEPTFIPTSTVTTTEKGIKARMKASLTGGINLTSTIGSLIGVDGSTAPTGNANITTLVGGSFYNTFATIDTLSITTAVGGWFRSAIQSSTGHIINGIGVLISEQSAPTNNIDLFIGPASTIASLPTFSGNYSIYSTSTKTAYFTGFIQDAALTPSELVQTNSASILVSTTSLPAGITANSFTFNSKINVSTASNAAAGSLILSTGTATVSNTSVTANSLILLTRKSVSGTPGTLSYTITAGTSFTINSSSSTDSGSIGYVIIN